MWLFAFGRRCCSNWKVEWSEGRRVSFRYIRLANEVVHSAKSSGSNLAKPFGEHPEHFYLVSRSSIAAGAAAEGDRQSRGEGEGEGPTLSSHIQLQYIFSTLLHFHFFPHSISWHYEQCTVSERESFAFIFRSLLFLFFCFSAPPPPANSARALLPNVCLKFKWPLDGDHTLLLVHFPLLLGNMMALWRLHFCSSFLSPFSAHFMVHLQWRPTSDITASMSTVGRSATAGGHRGGADIRGAAHSHRI